VVEGAKDVTKTTDEITIDGVTQTLTVYQANFTEKTLSDIFLSILQEVKQDPDIKQIVENIASFAEDYGMDSDSFSYEDFVDSVEEEIDKLKESAEDADDEDALFTMYTYVDGSDKVVGRKIEQNDEEALYYVTVENGGRFATVFERDEEEVLTASGTKQGDRITGEYLLKEDGETTCKLSVTALDEKALKNGSLDGTIRMVPSSDAIEDSSLEEYGSFLSVMDIAIEISGKGDANGGQFKVAVLNGEKPLFKGDMQYSVSPSKGVKEPSGKIVEVDLDNPTSVLSELADDLHLDQVVDNLRKTAVPKDWVDQLEKLSKQLRVRLQHLS
ncbi:MAG: hypothetical protein IKI63_00500, partial [Clostridia bacterium]|nr:hypothetical protein [Clostridia bacterium]